MTWAWLQTDVFHWTISDNILNKCIGKCIYVLASVQNCEDSCLRLWGLILTDEMIFFILVKMYNLLWSVLGPASTSLALGTSEVWPQRFYSRIFFHGQIFLGSFWTTDSTEFKSVSKHFLSMSSVRQLQWNFKKHTTTNWPEEDGDKRHTDFRGRKNPDVLTAAIRMLWNEYKYDNYMT